MSMAVIAITRHAVALAGRIMAVQPDCRLYVPEKLRAEAQAIAPGMVECYQQRLSSLIPQWFGQHEALIAIMSIGALIRMIAPCLQDKASDPAVIALDENGQFVIPLLSGHLGGANRLAGQLATRLGATAVLTTASDVRQTVAVDLLGHEFGWQIDASHAALLCASAAMVNDEPVALVQECGNRDWWRQHANGRGGPLPANLQQFLRLEEVPLQRFSALLWVSQRSLQAELTAQLQDKCVIYRPLDRDRIALGIGCDRDTPATSILQAIGQALDACLISPQQVERVASIDLKADEAGLLQAAGQQGWPLQFYPACELARVAVPHPSDVVLRHTGTPSVSAAAALLAAGSDQTQLIIEKHRLRGTDGRNVTISIARITP